MCLMLFLFWFLNSHILCHGNNTGDYSDIGELQYKRNPAPGDGRCGLCPTYYQKVCAFDHLTNSTFIFDNYCVMDLYNCIKGNEFKVMNYEHCIYFGNFAYVHGFKYEDLDYEEDHIIIKNSKKAHPSFWPR